MIRLLIVDDHFVVREGVKGILSAEPEFVIVGEATDGAEGVEMAAELAPDVVLMDLRMPNMDGVTAIKTMQKRKLSCNILVLTTFDTDADIVRAIEAGATGYLLKDAPKQQLFQAIRAAARGESVLAPAVATRLMTRMRQPASDKLSDREIEVLELVYQGKTNREIGRTLHISTATVKTHLNHIYDKLQVNDRTSAVTVALERGILQLG